MTKAGPAGSLKSLLVNSGWNFAGLVLPLLAALVAIPWLLSTLGAERVGLLTLVWVLVGYFGLFDFGMGRALTKMVAENHATNVHALGPIVNTGFWASIALGVVGGLVVALMAWQGGHHVPGMDGPWRDEVGRSMVWVALGTPVVVASAVLRGVVEGLQRFALLAAIRVPTGVAMFLAPAAVATFLPTLDAAVATTVAVRAVGMAAHVFPCKTWLSWATTNFSFRRLKEMLGMGGWITVSSVVGPLIVYVDRFVIGARMSAEVIVTYTAPFEMISRLLLIPAALSSALMPALSHQRTVDATRANRLAMQTTKLTALVVLPVVVVLAWLAPWWLKAWLGADLGAASVEVSRWLLVGFGVNALAQVPLVALLAEGRARAVAVLHLAELLVYGVVLIAMVDTFGLVGAAMAWALRAAFDTIFLFWLWLRH